MTKDNSKFPKKKIHLGGVFWRRVLLVIIGLIVGINAYSWNASTLGGNTMPMPFGIGASVVLSGSMSPALEVNDLIIVQEKDEYEVGDIVVFQSGDSLIVHRIVAKEDNMITTQGDANNVADDPVNINVVKGTVVSRIPSFGAVVNVLKFPAVGVLLLIGAVVLTERSYRAEKRKKEQSLDAIREEIQRLKADRDNQSK